MPINIYDYPEPPLSEELMTILAKGENVRVERIVSTGQTSGWYDQNENEFVVLVCGSAVLEFMDGKIELSAGDTLIIPPHCRHRVSYTSATPPCVWLCVFWE